MECRYTKTFSLIAMWLEWHTAQPLGQANVACRPQLALYNCDLLVCFLDRVTSGRELAIARSKTAVSHQADLQYSSLFLRCVLQPHDQTLYASCRARTPAAQHT